MERKRIGRLGLLACSIIMLVQIGGSSGCTERISKGESTYLSKCANCHGEQGEGLGALIPPLAGADFLRDNQDQLPCVIYYGLDKRITVNGVLYEEPMAGVTNLSVIDISNLINYINSSWGNDFPRVTVQQVRDLFEACPQEMPVQSNDTISSVRSEVSRKLDFLP